MRCFFVASRYEANEAALNSKDDESIMAKYAIKMIEDIEGYISILKRLRVSHCHFTHQAVSRRLKYGLGGFAQLDAHNGDVSEVGAMLCASYILRPNVNS
jgi:hypothetical protein